VETTAVLLSESISTYSWEKDSNPLNCVEVTLVTWDGWALLFGGYCDVALPSPFECEWGTERGWGGDVEVWFDESWLASTPMIALRVFGVIVAAACARAEEGVCGGMVILNPGAGAGRDGRGSPEVEGVVPRRRECRGESRVLEDGRSMCMSA
jgi:hypothetical protein